MSPEELMRFVSHESHGINGWFLQQDMISFWCIDFAQKQMGMEGDICEVGVYQGKSLVLLGKLARENESVYGYDLFGDNLLDITKKNLQQFGLYEKTHLIIGDTSLLKIQQLHNSFRRGIRILHIDAGHEYHEVVHQLHMFSPFVSQGGCIIMDDYQDREYPGIEAAVLDFCQIDRPRRFVPFFAGGNKMYLCESHMAQQYQVNFLQHDVFHDKCRTTRVRDYVVMVGFSKAPITTAACMKDISSFPYLLDNEMQLSILSKNAMNYSEIMQLSSRNT